MAAVSVTNLDDEVQRRLRRRAARHGRSMEAEIRVILTDAVREPEDGDNLATALLRRFGGLNGTEPDLLPRDERPRGADFE
ncbi:FitA-like ribbon-helix-helix domain-containing protein [Actinomadura flavalba]|uniref:FitA-like ribbon-helix-helix domain-containing protein n=1 Tax=Actinomadura flavalba TaxID=1120938 RepID=UPI0003A4F110|nr:Arc family DNA-binding protein [Actinomadura flavalba]